MEENTFLDNNPQYNYNQDMVASDQTEDNVFNRFFNPQIAENREFERENMMTDKANAFTEYMFNKANEYNTPQAQMERMKAAGINPNTAAAGIAGIGNQNAMPMQGAQSNLGMNSNAANPIEQLGTLATTFNNAIEGTEKLGNLIGFGEKNKAEINSIRQNAYKAAEEAKFKRRERKQLERIGQILIDNEELRGKEIQANIDNLNKLNEVYQQQKWNIAADTNLKTEQTGTEIQNKQNIWYDNMKKEYEKNFREIFGAELTHDDLQFLVEACLNGKGESIVKFMTDSIASFIKGIKNYIRDATTSFKIPKLKPKTPKEIHDSKNLKAMTSNAKRIWTNNRNIRFKYNGDYDKFLEEYIEIHKNDTMYKTQPINRLSKYYGDLK